MIQREATGAHDSWGPWSVGALVLVCGAPQVGGRGGCPLGLAGPPVLLSYLRFFSVASEPFRIFLRLEWDVALFAPLALCLGAEATRRLILRRFSWRNGGVLSLLSLAVVLKVLWVTGRTSSSFPHSFNTVLKMPFILLEISSIKL